MQRFNIDKIFFLEHQISILMILTLKYIENSNLKLW